MRRPFRFAGRIGALVALFGPLEARAGEDHRAYDTAINGARLALKQREYAEAKTLCRQAIEVSGEPVLGGPRRTTAARLCAEVEIAQKRYSAAARRFRDAARYQIDDLVARRSLLMDRKRAAIAAGASRHAAFATDLLEHDANLQSALSRPRRSGSGLEKTLDEIDAAQRAYRRDRDRGHAQLASAVRALVLARSGRPDDALTIAKYFLDEKTPKAIREVALEAQYWASAAKQELKEAATAAVVLNHLKNEGLLERRRRYARSREMVAACEAFDEKEGGGACARLAVELTGYATFEDFSRGKRKTELSLGDIQRVHDDGLAALELCVLGAARGDPDRYRGTDIEISWVIDREGEVKDVVIKPKRYKESLARCAAQSLDWLRYPKVLSHEPKNVTIPYRFD